MAWAASRRKGFFLVEAAVACLIAAIFIAAAFSTLFVSGALARRAEQSIKRERQKREFLAGYAMAASPGCLRIHTEIPKPGITANERS